MELTNHSNNDSQPCFIKNKKVIDFYRQHNSKIDFEKVNLYFVELFEKVLHHETTDTDNEKENVDVNLFEELSKNSVTKEFLIIGEKRMEIVLCNICPSDEIIKNQNMLLHCDYILKRRNKPTILFECKECDTNIDTDVTDFFIESLRSSNQSGVFISQHSGIIDKPNFHIEIYNGNVLVYIQNCNYDIEKIKSAIEIIDNLYSKLKSVNTDNNISINLELLNEINKEYQLFITYKESLIKSIKENNNNVIIDILVYTVYLDRFILNVETGQIKR
jgi:type II secretory pathway component GspD/PulD (secretin)